MNIYIIGFMGSGKSTTGKKLAAALDYKFVDLDDIIERKCEASVSEIFSAHGENYFREKEREVLTGSSDFVDTVIACGGGTPCFGDNIDFMNRSGLTIYLEMTPGQLKSRLSQSKSDRPLIASVNDDEILDYIDSLLKERSIFYKQAKIIVAGMSPDIRELAQLVREHPEYGTR